MEKNFKELLDKFKTINKMQWIKGINNNSNSVGLTFEKLINKDIDCDFLPDYKDIEIKCSQRYSRFPISLFSCVFDGPRFNKANYLVDKYGWKDEKHSRKILMTNLYLNKKTLINNTYYFKMIRKDKKLVLEIYNSNDKLIDDKVFVNLKTLEEHLTTKLSNLALIFASKKVIDNDNYFRYYRINFYKLRGFDIFLELLEKNVIPICIEYRIGKSGTNYNKYKNKQMIFQLPKNEICSLFNNIYSLDCDSETDVINNFQII